MIYVLLFVWCWAALSTAMYAWSLDVRDGAASEMTLMELWIIPFVMMIFWPAMLWFIHEVEKDANRY